MRHDLERGAHQLARLLRQLARDGGRLEAGAGNGRIQRGHVTHKHVQTHLKCREHDRLAGYDVTTLASVTGDLRVRRVYRMRRRVTAVVGRAVGVRRFALSML